MNCTAGTSDISFVESWSGCLEIIGTGAISKGGRDFDRNLASLIKKKLLVLNKASEMDLREDSLELLAAAEHAKVMKGASKNN